METSSSSTTQQRACILKEGKPVVTTIPLPALAADQVRVRISFAALNRRDYWITQGLYPGIQDGSVLGADGAGIVVEVGKEVKCPREHLLGQRVLIQPAYGWGEDSRAPNAKTFHILGLLPAPGTLCEYVDVPLNLIAPVPVHLSLQESACLPLAGLTAWRAVKSKAEVQPGHKVLVTGCGGGVAVFALQFAVALGAHVFVTSSSDEKLQVAKKLGAVGGVNYRNKEWKKQLQEQVGPVGFDAIIDGSGGNDAYQQYVRLCRLGARIVVYGATAEFDLQLNLPRLFLKQIEIRTTSMGTPREFSELLTLVSQFQLRPQLDPVTTDLADVGQTIASMEYMKQMGKLVIKVSGIEPSSSSSKL